MRRGVEDFEVMTYEYGMFAWMCEEEKRGCNVGDIVSIIKTFPLSVESKSFTNYRLFMVLLVAGETK